MSDARPTASAFHHTGLLVADLERSARFYVDVLGGTWLHDPILVEGPDAARVFGGPEGIAFRFSYVGFGADGRQGALELMQFVGDVRPAWATTPRQAWLPHFAVTVDDVPAAIARATAAGGTQLWPEITKWGASDVMYVADPDGNVLELFDTDLAGVVDATAALFPDKVPAQRAD